MSPLQFHPEALAEYEYAARHYEAQQAGLSGRFIEAVKSALDGIASTPQRWPVLEQDIRRRLTRVFPYAILYSAEADYILIIAVMHCHQEPGYWRTRIGA